MNPSKEIKYLGVILDDKLSCEAHVRAQVKKWLTALWPGIAFIGRAYRLSPKMTLYHYKRVIIHKITYVAVTWWDITDIALARSEQSELELLRRAACTMITGAMRTTTKVLEMHLDLPTFGMAMESAALKATYRLLWPNLRNLGIEHNRIWTKADKVDSKFSMIKDNVTLRPTFNKYKIGIPTREEWGKNWSNQLRKGHVWFTDGACNQ